MLAIDPGGAGTHWLGAGPFFVKGEGGGWKGEGGTMRVLLCLLAMVGGGWCASYAVHSDTFQRYERCLQRRCGGEVSVPT
jgi:hypothetical protein